MREWKTLAQNKESPRFLASKQQDKIINFYKTKHRSKKKKKKEGQFERGKEKGQK